MKLEASLFDNRGSVTATVAALRTGFFMPVLALCLGKTRPRNRAYKRHYPPKTPLTFDYAQTAIAGTGVKFTSAGFPQRVHRSDPRAPNHEAS